MKVVLMVGCLLLAVSLGACCGPNLGVTADERTIGSAQMDADGTIIMNLRAEGVSNGEPIIGEARVVYKRGDPRYEEILKHLGGLKPGESKFVKPWPDR